VSSRLAPGVLVAGTYVVDRFLGRGAQGEVWAAAHVWTRESVALKVLAAEAAGDDETVERFRREAIFLARAAGDHVARVVDFVSDPSAGMVLVMELVEGESLARVLDRRTLSVEGAVTLGVDLLNGVCALHTAGVIHRDLKPGNVLLRTRPDGSTQPVLCDFGLSRLARGRTPDASDPSLTDLTRGDVAMGTVRYMAPEQVLNARQATEASDLYAVGAILFRAVTGTHPFDDASTSRGIANSKVMREAPPLETGRSDAVARGLERVIMRALRRRPADRHLDATAMRDELARVAELARATVREDDTHRAPTPVPAQLLAMPARPARASSPYVAAAAVVLVFVAGVATGKLWTGHDARPVTAAAAPVVPVRMVAAEPAPPPLDWTAATVAEIGETNLAIPATAPAPPPPSSAVASPASATAPAAAALPVPPMLAAGPPPSGEGHSDNPY
jgi:serine/threonine-protein kinase